MIRRYLTISIFIAFVPAIPVYAESLFSDAGYESLVGDHRSHEVGDSITVLIYEKASSESTADTDTDRSAAISGEVAGNRQRHVGKLGLGNEFKGGGSITRTGQLVATVTVTVHEKLSNGELLVGGEQMIEFNDEIQNIRLTGRVRPADISADNTVLSSRLADSEISYVGDGLLGRRQKPGIITRFFEWLF